MWNWSVYCVAQGVFRIFDPKVLSPTSIYFRFFGAFKELRPEMPAPGKKRGFTVIKGEDTEEFELQIYFSKTPMEQGPPPSDQIIS